MLVRRYLAAKALATCLSAGPAYAAAPPAPHPGRPAIATCDCAPMSSLAHAAARRGEVLAARSRLS